MQMEDTPTSTVNVQLNKGLLWTQDTPQLNG